VPRFVDWYKEFYASRGVAQAGQAA
jgi:hypothetical protein